MNLNELKSRVRIEDVVGNFIAIKKSGRELIGLCPFHNDTKPSMTVVPDKQIFCCHACDTKGDVFDFVSKYRNVELPEAINIVKEFSGEVVQRVKLTSVIVTPPTSEPPIPDDAEHVWKYNESVYVVRRPNKNIRPLTHTDKGWRWTAPNAPKPKYIVGDGPTVICEGEKTADAIAAMGYRAITWMGGANSWDKTEWNLSDGVMMWPDHDWQGWAAMQQIALKCNITPQFITAPDDAPKGWDAADGDGTIPDIITLTDLTVVHDPVTGEAVRWITEHGMIDEPPVATPPTGYTALGFETYNQQTRYYFHSRQKNKVIAVPASGFSKSQLYDLHPDVSYWEVRFPSQGSTKMNVDDATCALMNECHIAGLYDSNKVRTRGAWIDDGRVVLHVGPHLIVDGVRTDIANHQTRYTYEWRQSIDFEPGERITKSEGALLVDALSLYNWEREINARLLAGWCFIAPLCGALKWRPHIWITGSSGTGKTKLMKDTVLPLMESIAITPEGESTEAGIRQHLDGDALPVLFDEAEAETKRAVERMEGILNLMRSASSGKSGQIMKGSASHTAKAYNVRSCFGFASIVYQASKKADRSRITVLGLDRAPSASVQREKWDEFNRTISHLMTDDFISGFHARAIHHLREIMASCEVFSKVVGEVLGDRRMGDQIGTMLAGAWMLTNDEVATEDDARRYIDGVNFDEEISTEEMDDEMQLLRYILQLRVRCLVEGMNQERTVGELILSTMDRGDVYHNEADAQLLRCGIKVMNGYMYVSNTATWLSNALRNTAWQKNHGKILQRLQGATAHDPMYYTVGISGRGTRIEFNQISILL